MSLKEILHYNVPMKELTTFEIGGPAACLATPRTLAELEEVCLYAREQNLPLYPLGDGSNILASDQGFDGVLVRCENCAISILEHSEQATLVRAEAGLPWDELVAFTVEHDFAGIECLSGIPGRVGSAPVQNIGAYGQEVANTISTVDVMDLSDGSLHTIPAADCAFGYRSSKFKGEWRGRYIITAVSFLLTLHGLPSIRYGDLHDYLAERTSPATLPDIRQAVLTIRRRKSMTYNPENPNHRSAGSFFLNPSVPTARAEELRALYADMPVYPSTPGNSKLSAAWLLEHSGFSKGYTLGHAGLSTHHVLALINNGAATASEILALSQQICDAVSAKFDINLKPEPNLLGF